MEEFHAEKIHEYFMNISDQLKTINLNNSYEVNAKNISEIKIPTIPRLKSDVYLKPQIEGLKNQIKSQKFRCFIR